MNGQILLANPRGFCAGVVRAIDIVQLALEVYGTPLYVLNEIVHNAHVVKGFREKGVQFVKSLDDVPPGCRVIFSAHGISPEVRKRAAEKELQTIDATCPLVTKVHLEALRYKRQNYAIILIGHREHEETIGTMGEAPDHIQVVGSIEEVDRLKIPQNKKIAYLTQTTLSLDDTREIIDRLRMRFPGIEGPNVDDICYATQNRQNAVQEIARNARVVLVIGSTNSSNSNRLVEVAAKTGAKAYLINDAKQINPEWLKDSTTIGITAGASTPEFLIQQVIQFLQQNGHGDTHELQVVQENVHFALPPELEPAKRT
jgi:4-hydroxy-3-methylbut-2-enyl diphosphate reductase